MNNIVGRKNSPIPYTKGRRSALSRMSQQNSPKNANLSFTQRSSFPRSQPHSNANENLNFMVKGSNKNKNTSTNKDKDSINAN